MDVQSIAMGMRVATRDDAAGITETLARAFSADPLWRWVFEDEAALRPWWALYVNSAVRFPHSWVLDDVVAAAMWIPPGESELSEEDEAKVEPLLEELVGDRAPEVLELLEAFDECHPAEPHYYLSLLGTHPDFRGHGFGMELLRETLAVIDAEGAAAYLESSNPANDERYARLGFEPHGSFTTPDGLHPVTTMWRAAQG
jgi:GNAT superfamily N-acetyltransferase